MKKGSIVGVCLANSVSVVGNTLPEQPEEVYKYERIYIDPLPEFNHFDKRVGKGGRARNKSKFKKHFK